MHTAAIGVTEKEDDEQGIDEQDIFYCVVSFLAAITLRLFRRILGADDTPLGPVMGKRGEAGAAAGTATRGAGSSARGVDTLAAAASARPRPCARGVTVRAGG